MQEPQYVVPRVDILEQPSDPHPKTTVQLNRIGIVGTFSWGPVNTPVRVYTMKSAERLFGGYKQGLTGWPSVNGAFRQGNMDITIVRSAGPSAKKASLTLVDASNNPSVVVTGKYPGTKPIQVSWQNGTSTNTGKLIVIADGVAMTYDNLTLDTLNTVNDPNVDVAKANGATALPVPINVTPLTGGDDGAQTQDSDYIGTVDSQTGARTGLKIFEAIPVNIVLCAQQTSAAVQAALLAHAANAPVSQGLRVAVMSMPSGQNVDQSASKMATLTGMRGIMAYNWVEPEELPGTYVSPDGYYAGVLASIQSHWSPSNKTVQGILSTQFQLSDDDVYEATMARMSPITQDIDGSFKIRNGVNMFVMPPAGGDDWSQINVRREFDKLETEIYLGTQWAKSNTDPKLPDQLATWIDELLRQRKVETQEIADFKATTAYRDPSNPRRVVTTIRVKPDWAADFIDHEISQWNGA
ncbi:hypothetical protein DNHGIG_15090 [Collibacillus ludicampi]|uniref:Tail sheath protein subtilisin-like domain-containing protein n=1 Tax=Collibacillus ludicampi TaxID=2771369 RepID=A0AAV4LDX5_9BACL|nr:phage tail sheath subtilisin-like domain-containing protein [Collibacillus ludicampi]GIM45960.1 hypothetical protein DNHGIG_15090 [Collibacillus ludicampi]